MVRRVGLHDGDPAHEPEQWEAIQRQPIDGQHSVSPLGTVLYFFSHSRTGPDLAYFRWLWTKMEIVHPRRNRFEARAPPQLQLLVQLCPIAVLADAAQVGARACRGLYSGQLGGANIFY